MLNLRESFIFCVHSGWQLKAVKYVAFKSLNIAVVLPCENSTRTVMATVVDVPLLEF